MVDPTCFTYNQNNGLCTSCYVGYELMGGRCIKGTAPDGDPNCKKFVNGVCEECSKGAIFNANRRCIVVDPTCKTYDQADGSCTSCYPGY